MFVSEWLSPGHHVGSLERGLLQKGDQFSLPCTYMKDASCSYMKDASYILMLTTWKKKKTHKLL